MTHESDPPARRRRVDPSLVGRLGPVARAIDGWKTRTLFPAFGVIPVERSGGSTAQAALPRPFRRVVVAFGEPIDPSVVHDRAGGGMAGGDLTDRVMFEIQRRSGQDHVDAYWPGGDASDGRRPVSRGRLTKTERRRANTVLP